MTVLYKLTGIQSKKKIYLGQGWHFKLIWELYIFLTNKLELCRIEEKLLKCKILYFRRNKNWNQYLQDAMSHLLIFQIDLLLKEHYIRWRVLWVTPQRKTMFSWILPGGHRALDKKSQHEIVSMYLTELGSLQSNDFQLFFTEPIGR